jgi:3-oxoacyl-[acyl-carrier protein] reductase
MRRGRHHAAAPRQANKGDRQVGVLDGKAAIVTGSARGIGRATASLLAEQGARVLINDLDSDVAEQAASEIQGETAVFGGDLTEEGVCDQLVEKAVDELGQLDIIVNNAGYTWDGTLHKMSDEQFQAMLDIHTVVPFRIARAAAPHLREPAKKEKEEGKEVFRKIVNITSVSGTMGNAGQANYSAGKSGVVGLTKTLAKEWGQFRVNVNAVAFGFVETRLTAAKEEGGKFERQGQEIQLGIPEQQRQMASMLIPLGRGATPEEAAGPVFFLCSPWSNYVHGQVLNCTGGQFGGMYF